jgi:uncharacterized membrane protein
VEAQLESTPRHRGIKTPVGVASIGGAGTFDGIVLSGILATFLAVQ